MRKLLPYFKNLKFKKKLFISYTIVVIIPIMVLGIYSYNRSITFLKDQAKTNLYDLIKQKADNINYKLKKYNGAVDFIAYNTRIQQMFSNNYTNYLLLSADLKEYFEPFFNNIMYLNNDVDQVTVYTENNIPEYGKYIRNRKSAGNLVWYDEAGEKTSWYNSNKKFFGTRKLTNLYDNRKLGVIYIKPNYDKLFEDIELSKQNEYGIIVTDSQNNVIFSKDTFKEEENKQIADLILNAEKESIEVHAEDFIILKRSISEAEWMMYYYMPSEGIIVNAKSIITATVIIIGICILILILIIWLFSNTFVKRINWLNNKMNLVKEGNLEVEVVSQSKDEIGELINDFGDMLKRINTLINEVYQSKIIQREAELKALQAQINPHFLYNTLSLINWKAIQAEVLDISYLANTISKFYRTSLNNGKNIISVSDEMDNTKSYLEIQLAMHNNNFDVIYDVDESLYKYNIIKLILQPITENAIVHGIEKKRGNHGILEISGYIEDENLVFVVKDNGAGISDDILQQIFITKSKGYGLNNVQERIQLFFGEKYGIHIKSTVGEGTCVKVTLPKYTGNC